MLFEGVDIGTKTKRKLIDIGLCRFHRIFGILSGRLLKDIGWSVRLLILVNQLLYKSMLV